MLYQRKSLLNRKNFRTKNILKETDEMIDIFYFFLHNLSPLLMNPFVSLPFASFLFFLKGKSLG